MLIGKMKLRSYFFITALMLKLEDGSTNTIQKAIKNNRGHLLIILNSDGNLKSISRANYDHLARKERLKSIKLENEHKARVEEIIEFIKTHRITTVYLLEEIRRIKRDYKVKDELREMVSYLEEPENQNIKEFVLSVFNRIKKEKVRGTYNIYNFKPNDPVINVVKDPFNDGVIN